MAFSDDHIPDIGSLAVASLPTFIKIVAAYEAHRAIVVHDSKVWSSKSARTQHKNIFFGATKKRPFGKKKRPFLVKFSMRESEAHRKGPRKSFLSKAAVCLEKTAVWRKKGGAFDFHHQAH